MKKIKYLKDNEIEFLKSSRKVNNDFKKIVNNNKEFLSNYYL